MIIWNVWTLSIINNYKFIDRSPENFEKNNTNISLTVYNESGIIIHTPTNNSSIKARIVKINNYRYHAVKPPMPKLLKKKSILLSLPHKNYKIYSTKLFLKRYIQINHLH